MKQILCAAVVACCCGSAFAQIDGAGVDAGDYTVWVTQTNCTGYGNSTDPVNPNGNELNAVGVAFDGTNLLIGATGNLEQNGNAFLIFLDTDLTPGNGQAVLNTTNVNGPPFAMNGLHNSTFDPGFEPDFGFAGDVFGGNLFISRYTFINGLDAIREYLGSDPVNSGDGTLDGGTVSTGTLAAFNNTNVAGVAGCPDPVGDPNSATTGLEASIPVAELGGIGAGDEIRVFVLLSSGSGDGFFSNQAIPSFTPDSGNTEGPNGICGCINPPGVQPGFDFGGSFYGGQQWFSFVLGQSAPCPADLTGDGQVNQNDLNVLLANFNSGPGGDIDGDGDTDQGDLNLLLAAFNTACP